MTALTHLYGQEINPETYAICKADMLLKGEGESAEHVVVGAEWSTLAHDALPARELDFMLSKHRVRHATLLSAAGRAYRSSVASAGWSVSVGPDVACSRERARPSLK